uniref:uncharacterized protein LOC124050000 n=1 Tax=Scatophagus argus TaxID=75038 RepID=UPI001ED7E820|nr:uncharacterized protein LOC124050000 [Scatophagus argus]
MVKLYIQKAKDRHIAKELALLRASNPTPPMISHLDEVDDAAIEEGIRRAVEARLQPASSVTSSDHTTAGVQPSSLFPCKAPCDHTSPNVQPASAIDNEVACDTTVERNPARTPYQSRTLRKTLSALRKPASGCKNCQVLFTELKVVKQLLECEIERSHELKQLHSSTNRTNAVKYRRSKAPHYVKLVEEKQESSGPDEYVRKRLYQQQRNKMVRTCEEEGVSEAKPTQHQTPENSEKEDDIVARKTYKLRKIQKFVLPKQRKPQRIVSSSEEDDGTDHQKHMESSSGEDGTDDWKPTQNDSDDDSEESEEEISNLPKKSRMKRYVLQRQKQMEGSSQCDETPNQEFEDPILQRWSKPMAA